jgi:hypothetical protein
VKNYIYILVIISMLISVYCGESTMDNKPEETNLNSTGETNITNNIQKNSSKNKPSINSMSRLGFIYKPLSEDDKPDNKGVGVYEKIDQEEPKFISEENTNVWVNLTREKGWYQVIIDDSTWGYVKKENIKLYPRAIVNIRSGTLNLREGKGTDSKIIKGLEKDKLVYVISIEDKDWFEIMTSESDEGYVSSKYLKFIDKKTNLFVGISQEEFLSRFNELQEEEYLLLMEDYKLTAINKHMVRGDFNGRGSLDKAFFALKNNTDTINLIIWHSESNRYIIVETLKMPSFVGIELFPKEEELTSSYEDESVNMIADGISLKSYNKGYDIIYYWEGKTYQGFIYNK